ncbi:MAG: DNA gyrase subunit A [Acidobacteria bacterium RBG_16_70_10]|nr:MAG: DNA gyrase subunit A [Acidobacteria bacterium RBG_16_70_10]
MEAEGSTQNRIPTNIADEMRQSYMDYAMSVIIGRALPDVRDGLKPANRRVLYGMQQMGLLPGRPYRKSAKIVGEVMGNYHPHGDAAIYDTLVRMAQAFNMRAPLVDGQGNFGSVDGDPPAAQRYTEARLTRLGASMMEDIEKETVDFQPTYDDSSIEPTVLPTVLPNLLVNGAAGIAVGMATNIPPHNLGEVVDGLRFLLDNPDLTPDERLEGLLVRIPGPDFPTGGFILGREGIRQAHRGGRGTIIMRARAEIEPRKGDREAIVISEIPYQVNKARLIEKIAELARDERIKGIADVRDESDRRGMRIVVDVKKSEPAQVILNNLYKHTPLQDSFGAIFLAIVDQRPRVLNLLEAGELFLAFRRDVVRRRTAHDLRRAEARAHVLEGYVIALDRLDEVIALIRGAKNPEQARAGLVARFPLTEVQAEEILKLQLQRLTGMERQKIVDELKEIRERIADLRDILASPRRIDRIIGDELKEIRDVHGDPRRTEIVAAADALAVEDLIADEDVAISITHTGYVKRTSITSYRAQKRGGRGRVGMKTREEDFVSDLFIASTHSYILTFTDRGRVYWLKVHEIPDVGPQGKGKAVVNLVPLQQGEKIAAFCAVRGFDAGGYVLLATRKGIVKKTELGAFANPRPSGIIALSVDEGDALIDAVLTGGEDELLIGTERGMAIRFRETNVRPMGRSAYGVKGIVLEEADEVVALEVVRGLGTVLTVTRNGFGKRTSIEEYRRQTRGGKGLINIKASGRNGPVVGVKFLRADEHVMLITGKGMIIRLNTADISTIGRNTQGVRLIQLEEGDHLVSVARLAEREEEEPPSGPALPGEGDGAP